MPSPGKVPVVDVCPGTYAEQVTIGQSLTVTRAPVAASQGDATIKLPASVGTNQLTGLSTTNCQATDGANKVQTPQSVLEVCAAKAGGGNTTGVKVTVSNLTIEGNWPGSVCYDSLYDVLVEGGASLNLTGSVVEKAGAVSPLSGCQGGVGVQASSLPKPAPPAFVRPIDTVSTPAVAPSVFANTYDGKQYLPS